MFTFGDEKDKRKMLRKIVSRGDCLRRDVFDIISQDHDNNNRISSPARGGFLDRVREED